MDPSESHSTCFPTDGQWTADPVPRFQFRLLSDYPQITHAVFTRHGGKSRPPYDSLNTSYQVGDLQDHVTANLSLIREAVGARRLVAMRQVHGTGIARARSVNGLNGGWTPCADALITDVPGVAVVVRQADCQGVIILDPEKDVLSVVHCGWRGNAANILGQVIARMKREWDCNPCSLLACIGPSLGSCCAEFVDHTIFPKDFNAFKVDATHFDMKAVSRCQLLSAGLTREHIQVSDLCTRCRTDLFYSYRGERTTGRFATVAMLNQGGARHAKHH